MLDNLINKLNSYSGVDLRQKAHELQTSFQERVVNPAYAYYQYMTTTAPQPGGVLPPAQPANGAPNRHVPSAGAASVGAGDAQAGLDKEDECEHQQAAREKQKSVAKPAQVPKEDDAVLDESIAQMVKRLKAAEEKFMKSPSPDNTSEYISVLEIANKDLQGTLADNLRQLKAARSQLDKANAERSQLRARVRDLQDTNEAQREEILRMRPQASADESEKKRLRKR